MNSPIKVIRFIKSVAVFTVIATLAAYLLYFLSPYNDKVRFYSMSSHILTSITNLALIVLAIYGLINKRSFGFKLYGDKKNKPKLKETVKLTPQFLENPTAIWWNLAYILIGFLSILTSWDEVVEIITILITGSK
jgi:hypothetical protein